MTGLTYKGDVLINYSLRHGKLIGPSGKALKQDEKGKVKITINGKRKPVSLDDIINENMKTDHTTGKKEKKKLGEEKSLELSRKFTEQGGDSIFPHCMMVKRHYIAGEEVLDKELFALLDTQYVRNTKDIERYLEKMGVCNSQFFNHGLLDDSSLSSFLFANWDKLLQNSYDEFNLSAAAISFCINHNISAVILSDTPHSDKRAAMKIASYLVSSWKNEGKVLMFGDPLTDLNSEMLDILYTVHDRKFPLVLSDRFNTFFKLNGSIQDMDAKTRSSVQPYQFIYGIDKMNHPEPLFSNIAFKFANSKVEKSAQIFMGDIHNVSWNLEGLLQDYRHISFESLLDYSDGALKKIANSKELIVIRITNHEKGKVPVEVKPDIPKAFESKLEWYSNSKHMEAAMVLLSGLGEFPRGRSQVVVRDMDKDNLPESFRTDKAYKAYLIRHILEVLEKGQEFTTENLFPSINETIFAIFGMNNINAVNTLMENDLTTRDKFEKLLIEVLELTPQSPTHFVATMETHGAFIKHGDKVNRLFGILQLKEALECANNVDKEYPM